MPISVNTCHLRSAQRLIFVLAAMALLGQSIAAPAQHTDAGPITTGEAMIDDTAIAARINAIHAGMAELARITVSVEGGVVTLGGVAPTQELHDQALSIARRVEGVVAVRDEIAVNTEVSTRLETALSAGVERLSALAGMLPLVGVALIVLIVSYLAARFVWAWESLYSRLIGNLFIRNLLRQLTGVVVFVCGILFALELLEATAIVGAVLGAAGVAGLAIGFAFKDTIENYIAGILLSLRQPFAPHDHVKIDGWEGHVARLTSRATVLVTLDGNYVRIPNAKVFQGVLLNYSRNPLRRFDFRIGIGTDVDINAAQQLAHSSLHDMAGVLDEPEPLVVVEELGDSNVVLVVLAWVDQREVSFGKVRSESIKRIKQEFERAGFDMPEPIYRLRVSGAETVLPDGGAAATIEETTAASSSNDGVEGPATEADIAPDRHMIEQVEQERERGGQDADLLDDAAPQE